MSRARAEDREVFSDGERKFELPLKLEKILAILARHFGEEGKVALQTLLVNSTYKVDEAWTSDNWDGGTYGHSLTLFAPATIYFDILKDAGEITKEVGEGIDRISNVQNEHIARVVLELQDDSSLENWRTASAARITDVAPALVADGAAIARLWIPEALRVFVSHKASFKGLAADLKSELGYYGVDCFVAHEDIEPTREWQIEIERALFSMEALLALLTDDFHDSNWTDQEVGVAMG